jgi:hypothetical protein
MSKQTLVERSSQDFIYGKFSPSIFDKTGKITIVPWSSIEGRARLEQSKHKEDFFTLANFYQPQINSVYCGVASAVIVMNALVQPLNQAPIQEELAIRIQGSGKPLSLPAYSQQTLLGSTTDKIKRKDVIEYRAKDDQGNYKPGLSLLELKNIMEAYQFKVVHNFPSDAVDIEDAIVEFRKLVKVILTDSAQYLIIHFRSDTLGGIPKGHISPLGAYDEISDSVLILDVAGHKGPWYWAPLGNVVRAMAYTYDTQPKGGGYLIVSR